jgi:hypothetical protein
MSLHLVNVTPCLVLEKEFTFLEDTTDPLIYTTTLSTCLIQVSPHENALWLILFKETLTYHRVEPRGEVPERRCGHTASIIDGRIWVFGGRVKVKKGDSFLAGSGVQYRNDLYCFDPSMSSIFLAFSVIHKFF